MTARLDPRNLPRVMPHRMTIGGAGGGKGSAGGEEAPDTLKSRQVARLVDLLSEGPIRGIVGGLRGVFLDGTPLQKADGSLNFKNASVQFVLGYPDQPIMSGFSSQMAEQAVGVQLTYGTPQVRTIINTDVDRTRITVSVPTLQQADDEGNITGTSVSFRIECQANGGGFQLIGDYTISGKTTSRYQRSVLFVLPRGGPWDLRVTRLTADSASAKLQNDLHWDSYTEIIDDRVNYSHSACVGIMIDAEQFASIPKRTYLVDGLLVRIPSNYNPDTAVYTGPWDGTFSFNWTNNPAWCFYDLVVNNRYGIGDFISAAMIDKWILYRIGQYCDGPVPDGKGGFQRRFTCNIQITSQFEAFDLLKQMASVFRGDTYWNGSQLVAVADMPADPVMQFTNANVIDGHFSYSGSDLRARHTLAQTSWRDPLFLGESRLAVVENQAKISRFGLQQADLVAIGCTNEGQAIRTGKWALYTEEFEAEVVQFSTGLESAWCRPFDIIQVMDALIAGTRRGGRVLEGSTASLVLLDAPITGTVAPYPNYLSCIVGEGQVETRSVLSVSGAEVTMAAAFSAAPAPGSSFVLTVANRLEPTLWRVLGAKQEASDKYTISGTRHLPSKWGHIEQNLVLTQPDTSDIQMYPSAVTGINLVEYMRQTSPISVGVFVTLSWISPAPLADVFYRQLDNNWQRARIDSQAIDLQVSEGIWTFQITPVSSLGFKGPTTTIQREIIGRFAPPRAPQQFRVNVVDSVALFDWLPATELDVIIGGNFELRYTTRTTGAQWSSAQVVIPSIPGTSTSVETGYQAGTWFLRTFDIVGTPSETWATIIAFMPDDRYQNYLRICEQPTWPGTFIDTEVKQPQEWLVIAESGMSPGGNEGSYLFSQIIDAGGVFSVRLSADILSFEFSIPDDFIDSRMTLVDTWQDWDFETKDLAGQITLLISHTPDDPEENPNWSPWQRFIAGEYRARAFRFQALLTAPPGQNIGIEELCILADLRNKMDEGADYPYPAVQTRVTFRIKFFLAPSVVVTVQDGTESDRVTIVGKTTEYFDIKITNAGGAQVTRTFDWHAQGY